LRHKADVRGRCHDERPGGLPAKRCVSHQARHSRAGRKRKPAEARAIEICSPQPLVRVDRRCARAVSVPMESERGSGSCFDAFSLREPVSTLLENALVAPNDVDIRGLLCPVIPGNRHRLRCAIRHVRSCRGCDIRREAMYCIPRNIIRVGIMDIARRRRRDIWARFAIGRPVIPIHYARPESVSAVSTVMPERSGDGRARSRMRRGSRALPGSCACECLARSKH
jgi:hypothetical protein